MVYSTATQSSPPLFFIFEFVLNRPFFSITPPWFDGSGSRMSQDKDQVTVAFFPFPLLFFFHLHVPSLRLGVALVKPQLHTGCIHLAPRVFPFVPRFFLGIPNPPLKSLFLDSRVSLGILSPIFFWSFLVLVISACFRTSQALMNRPVVLTLLGPFFFFFHGFLVPCWTEEGWSPMLSAAQLNGEVLLTLYRPPGPSLFLQSCCPQQATRRDVSFSTFKEIP